MSFLGVNEDKLGASLMNELKADPNVVNGAASAFGAALGSAIIAGLIKGIPEIWDGIQAAIAKHKAQQAAK